MTRNPSQGSPRSRLQNLTRQLQPASPYVSAASQRSKLEGQERLGTFRLGPHVSIPVFAPKHPSRLPAERLLLNLQDPTVLEHLEFLGKKWQLGQDVFLISTPGPYARRLSLTFAALLQIPFEYISLHKDVGEAELLQTRSLKAGGNLSFEDGPVVRAMKNGHLLIIEGVEKAERGVTPIINNILENREQNLNDGRHLIPAEKLATAREQESKESGHEAKRESRFIPVHPNFRVIATGVPVPPYKGLPLDPPFRSRFQARWVEGNVGEPKMAYEKVSNVSKELSKRWSDWASLVLYHTSMARGNEIVPPTDRLPPLPSTALPLIRDVVEHFPPAEDLPPLPTDHSGEPNVAVFASTEVEQRSATGRLGQKTIDLLGTAYPQMFTMDARKRNLLHDLLGQLRLDEGLGEGGDQASLQGTGLLGYTVKGIQRVGEKTARITFVQATSGNEVSIQAPCGPLLLEPVPKVGEETDQGTVVTPRVMSIFTTLLQLHCLDRDVCLVPAAFGGGGQGGEDANCSVSHASSSTSTCISLMASALGYALESVWLWKDLGGSELVMRRATGVDGSTTWEPAPLIRGAMDGKLIHLAGVDVLGSTLGSLSRLTQDREFEVWNGGRLTLAAGGEAVQGAKPEAGNLDWKEGQILKLPTSFRIVATAPTVKQWLNEEASTIFATCATQPMDAEEEKNIIFTRTGASGPGLKKLLEFAERYRTLSADPNLGLQKSRRLGTRQMIRMATRLAHWPETDLHGLIWRNLLVDFLPATVRGVVKDILNECRIFEPGMEGSFQYRPRTRLTDPVIRNDSRNGFGGVLEFGVTTVMANDDHQAEGGGGGREEKLIIPRFDVESADPEGKALIPDLQGSFYNNAQQSGLICSFAQDLEMLNEHLLLMGSQGTGKNKLIDRTLELLGRPREYIQMNRDSTVNALLQQVSLEGGQIKYHDSPLIRAIKLGRVMIVDEADKCSTAVSAVFKSLAERGQLSLPDGRRVRPAESQGGPQDIVVHPSFRLVLLSNRPGWPFFGNNFVEVIGEGFSCYAVSNPDVESEVRLLKAAAPDVPAELLRRLDLAFHDLREGFEAGLINHPYSLRELLHLVAHMQKYPDESLSNVLLNTLSFDLHRPESLRWVVETLRKRKLDVEDLDVDKLRESSAKGRDGLKIQFDQAKQDFDPEKEGRSTDLDKPKLGKEDPDNNPHVGGNTWRGGTGGRDTAGLGGRGGFERLYKGHKIHQVSDRLKSDVPDHIKKQARAMARAALERELNEQGMQSHEAVNLHELKQRVSNQVSHLSSVLNELEANSKERSWLARQQDGELDERRLSEGLMGERSIFKRRSEAPPEIGAPQIKPKRVRVILDVSASMYHMQFDGRLQRELETCLMLMQAMNRVEPEKFAFDIVGHSGDDYLIPLVEMGKLPKTDGDQYRVLRSIVSHTQYCDSGDHTLKCIEESVRRIRSEPITNIAGQTLSGASGGEEADDYFVIALSDANLSRYGITSKSLGRVLSSDDKVKAAVIFIDKGNDAIRASRDLPGKAFVAPSTKDVPRILNDIMRTLVT
ncbi:hypothetical protein IE53DRAFT_367543 [Violaceomyces palustris]|uniref:Uncharacterized protein n=1 Tax=Violaceomyces palustris TaxID=1673888 RepID=A0ACD0P1Z3_9BASI|nr:hypothetical protein IE53DRAFT_367543 [Violaceomyces palustris]